MRRWITCVHLTQLTPHALAHVPHGPQVSNVPDVVLNGEDRCEEQRRGKDVEEGDGDRVEAKNNAHEGDQHEDWEEGGGR